QLQIVFGNYGSIKAKTLDFPQARFQMRNTAYFAPQTYFPYGYGLFPYRQIQQAGGHSNADRKIASGFVQLQTANDIHIDVLIGESIPGATLQNGKQKVHPIIVKATGSPPWTGEAGFGYKGLNFTQNRTGSVHNIGDTGGADPQGPVL